MKNCLVLNKQQRAQHRSMACQHKGMCEISDWKSFVHCYRSNKLQLLNFNWNELTPRSRVWDIKATKIAVGFLSEKTYLDIVPSCRVARLRLNKTCRDIMWWGQATSKISEYFDFAKVACLERMLIEGSTDRLVVPLSDFNRIPVQRLFLKNCYIEQDLDARCAQWRVRELIVTDCVVSMENLHKISTLHTIISLTDVIVMSSSSVEKRLSDDYCLDGNLVALRNGETWKYRVVNIKQDGTLPLKVNELRLSTVCANVNCSIIMVPVFTAKIIKSEN